MSTSASSEGYEPAPLDHGSLEEHARAHAALAGCELPLRAGDDPTPDVADPDRSELEILRGLLDRKVGQPVFETYFLPVGRLPITVDHLGQLIPSARFQRRSDNLAFYPNDAAPCADSPDLTSQGWLVRADRGPARPSWGWALGLGGTFLDRQDYWEDYPPTARRIIGASWLSARVCMLLHLLHRCAGVLNLRDATRFLVAVRLTGTEGRFLLAESGVDVARVRQCVRPEVNSEVAVTVGRLRREFRQIVTEIVRDVAWKMERTDVKPDVVASWLDRAVRDFGERTLFSDDTGGAP